MQTFVPEAVPVPPKIILTEQSSVMCSTYLSVAHFAVFFIHVICAVSQSSPAGLYMMVVTT